MRVSDKLLTMDGIVRITSVGIEPGLHTVFNIEVDGDHEYFVGSSGILSHNGAAKVGGTCVTEARALKKGVKEAAEKRPRKRGPRLWPHGPHNQTIKRRIDELHDELGPDWVHVSAGPLKRRTIRIPGAKKLKRRADIEFYNPKTGKYYREQVGKTDRFGNPIKRVIEALDDIEKATGDRPKYTP